MSKRMKRVRAIAVLLILATLAAMMTACGDNSSQNSEDVTITVGYWPNKANQPSTYALYEKYAENMKEKYPNITIIPDEFEYGVDTFLPAAASGQIPNLYRVPFTEVSKIVDAGYAADITEMFKKYGYEDALKPGVRDLVVVNDKYYGIPYNGYIVGMMYNVELFKEAGLVDEDGKPIYPTNFEELKDTAVQIKEKTGKAGFTFPTVDKQGGWMFMSLAWSFGVKFMDKVDGKWTATFDSPEMVEALQYISDLKWKYNVLPENILLSRTDIYQLFASNQVACLYAAGDWPNGIVSTYGMNLDSISLSPVPEGKAGAYSQIGGDIWMVSPDSTKEQIDAIFKWLSVKGNGVSFEDDTLENLKESYRVNYEKGLPIAATDFSVYDNAECEAQRAKAKEPYLNVNPKTWNTMYSDHLILKPEEPVEAQQLYAAITPVLQAILTNKNADIPTLVKETNANFQKDFLDKLNK